MLNHVATMISGVIVFFYTVVEFDIPFVALLMSSPVMWHE